MSGELVFYTNPMSRGRIVRWMLEEIGEPYRTEIIEFGPAMKSPEYLAVNPMGKVPAIRHGDTVVTETGAICAYLADAFPQAGLAPAPGSRERGSYYRWLFFGAGPVDGAIVNKSLGFEPPAERQGMVGYGTLAYVLDTLEKTVSASEYLVGRQILRRRPVPWRAARLGNDVRRARKAAGLRDLLEQDQGPASSDPRPRNRRCAAS